MNAAPVPSRDREGAALPLDAAHYGLKRTASLLQKLSSEMERVTRDPDADAVHDVRVAIRRFSQALKVFQDFLPARGAKRIRRDLRHMIDAAGAVRDRDIAAGLIKRLAGPPGETLRAAVLQERAAAAATLVGLTQNWLSSGCATQWKLELNLEAAPIDVSTPPGEMARALLPKRADQFFQRGRGAADHAASARALHRFRIAAKKFRYTLELFQPCYGPRFEDYLSQIRKAQTLLGDINDCEASRNILKRHHTDEQLLASLMRRERAKVRQFHRYWPELGGDGAEARWRAYLRRPTRLLKAVANAVEKPQEVLK